MYPRKFEVNRLFPNDSQHIPMTIDSKTVGSEQLVILAIKAQREPIDFALLAQPSLALAEQHEQEKSQVRGDPQSDPFKTPLGLLLKRGMFGEGQSRGPTADEIDGYAIVVVPLQVRRGIRPEPTKMKE
jgi:hypothetical protein